MIDLLLILAQSVLSPIIVDLVTGRTAAVRKREIEVAIATAAREKQPFTSDQIDKIVQRTMEEVVQLVQRNPDLDWKFQKVKLARPVKENQPERRDEIVTERLRRLADLVEQRRKDLGLPLFVEGNPSHVGDAGQAPSETVVWEPSAVSEESVSPERELWLRELEGMKGRVERRRAQGRKSSGDI